MRFLVICCLALFLLPRSAAAEWHLVPMAGLTTFANTSILDVEQATGRTRVHGGAGVAWLSRGIFGVEALGFYTPSFFEGDHAFGDVAAIDKVKTSRTVSLMANVVATLPQRWTEYGLRPFVSAGFGLLHANATGGVFPVDVNTTGFNVGGGAVGFLSPHTGLRFDVRYHTTLNREANAPAFGDVHLRYVTMSVGLVFRRGRTQ